ncbi:MAG: NAD(P)-dependent oxidoreductase, partial [Alphaproteobacteria bacterium]|nr:NAD(P)-dependent oxidoreductase [Alphaproteobacteria bacterium]
MSAAPRLMLLGACGQVGQALRQTPLPFGWELGLYGHKDMDIARPAALREAVQRFRPDLIMNAAAFTKIDEAEQAPDKAIAVNFEAVAHLAAQCSALDIPLIHLSTDHVFDGRDETPYPPDFPMNPLNIYGQSKMMGEEAIRHELAWHVILRTSWVFSSFGNNVLTRLLQKIDSGA